jgi:two-component system, cell cycle response regulator
MTALQRILVLDGSRVVRATLTKHLRDDFEVREEDDGESAWQTLVLDASIVAIIAGVHPPKLEAGDLLQRIRSSPLRRLQELPFLLLVSDIDNHIDRQNDRANGVTDFITRTMKKTAIIQCLREILEPCTTIECTSLYGSDEMDVPPIVVSGPPSAALLSSDELLSLLAQHAHLEAKTEGLCALIFGIDDHEVLIDQFGEKVAAGIESRFASLLIAKLGPRDLIARYPGERLAIVSRHLDLGKCVRFAKRVCRSLAAGQITIHGQPVKVTASAGVASASEDGVAADSELLALASRRLDQARTCGGNIVSTEYKPNCPWHHADLRLPNMLATLNARSRSAIAPRIATLGLQILPLLKMIDEELALGLPLLEIRRQLEQRAETEKSIA